MEAASITEQEDLGDGFFVRLLQVVSWILVYQIIYVPKFKPENYRFYDDITCIVKLNPISSVKFPSLTTIKTVNRS